jgi:DNA-binding CsgD family transcriptional regulator
MCLECSLGISEKDISYCYGMSKMTVANEVENSKEYSTIKAVEFIEFLGRLAYLRDKASGQALE